jgi:genome maintenance exonuclease 1
MIVNKFPYLELKRINSSDGRKYITPSGDKLPSVTTILSKTSPKEKIIGLQRWRDSVGAVNAQAITNNSAGRGTRMHAFLENYIKTGSIGLIGNNPHSIKAHSMAEKIVSESLHKATEFYGSEISLFYPDLYAGTTDLIGVYEEEPVIIDFKQSNKHKKEEWIDDYFCQLYSYLAAHNKVFGTNIRRGIIMMCTPDLIYQQFELNEKNFEQYSNKWWDRLHQYYNMM